MMKRKDNQEQNTILLPAWHIVFQPDRPSWTIAWLYLTDPATLDQVDVLVIAQLSLHNHFLATFFPTKTILINFKPTFF